MKNREDWQVNIVFQYFNIHIIQYPSNLHISLFVHKKHIAQIYEFFLENFILFLQQWMKLPMPNFQRQLQKIMYQQAKQRTEQIMPDLNGKTKNKKQKQQTPILPQRSILTYYYIRGLCQPVRNLLYYLDIQFEDRRLDKNSLQSLQLDKLQSTFNSGLPAFNDQYVNISDSVAICIHICNKYNITQLTGRTLKLKAKVNQVLFKYWMEKKKIMPEIAEIIRKTTGYHQTQKGVMIRQLINKLVSQTRFINFCLKNHQKNDGDWVLGEITLIDFFFYQTCFYVNGFFNSYIQGDQRLESFISFAHKFQELQFHKIHDQKKTKLFFPFKSENLREIVISAWQGDEEQQIL